MNDAEEREKVMRGLEACQVEEDGCTTLCKANGCPYNGSSTHCMTNLHKDTLALLKEQEPRILSLGEAIEGKNGLEIDPWVFVEIKGRDDIFIGSVNNVSHYNYPDLCFEVGKCFQINRNFPVSKIYPNSEYMKTVRCWTHKPSKEQRKAVEWDD